MKVLAQLTHAWRQVLLAGCLLLAAAQSLHAQVCVNPGLQGDVTTPGTGGPVNGYFTPANGTYAAGTAPTFAMSGGRGSATWVAGDMAMLIQMQCADIDQTNTDNYGDGAAGRPASGYIDPSGTCLAGRYEYVLAAPGTTGTNFVAGANLQFTYVQANPTPSQTRRSFQVVRVPQFRNLTLGGQLAALPWNGDNGGVVALDVSKTLNFGGQTVSVVAMGFRGGGGRAQNVDGSNPVRYNESAGRSHGTKGEGIAGTPRYVYVDTTPFDQGTATGAIGAFTTLTALVTTGYPGGSTTLGFDFARGAPGNAGGGGQYFDGNYHNGSGGGGANGGAGGRGAFGYRGTGWAGVLADYSNIQAITGQTLAAFGGAKFGGASLARVVMGGGGGAGDSNDNSGTLTELQARLSGAGGAGIVMLRANSMTGSGVLDLRGASANHNPCNDSAGAGGAGGSVVMITPNWSANVLVRGEGGAGGDAWRFATGICGTPGSAHSGGGGGGGGVVVRSDNIVSGLTVNLGGGVNGKTNTVDNPPGGEDHGAQPGFVGVNIPVPEATATPPNVGYKCIPQVDPSITKTATPTNLTIPQTVTFTLTIGNAGPAVARTVTIADTMPPGFNTPTLVSATGSNATTTLIASAIIGTDTFRGTATVDVGQTLTIVLRAAVNANGSLLNTASVATSNDQAEVNAANNVGSVTVVVGPAADVSVVKTATPSFVTVGQTVTFTLVLLNVGPSAVTNARVADALPSNFGTVTFGGATPSGGTWVAQNITGLAFSGTVTLPANTSVTVRILAVAGTSSTAINSATITLPAGITDPNPANNFSTASVAIGVQADLSVSKAASPTIVTYEGTTSFTITLVNLSAVTVTATLSDPMPSGVSVQTITTRTTAGGANVIAQTVVLIPPSSLSATVTMPPNSTAIWALRVFAAEEGVRVNEVSVGLTPGFVDTNPANNTAQASIAVPVPTGLGLTKSNVVTSLTAGQTTSYTITVENFGPNAANGLVITDAATAGLGCSVVTCAASGGAACPAGPLNFATLSVGGYVIGTFPGTARVVFTVRCDVTATGQ